MRLKSKQIIKEEINPYWANEKELIKNYTLLSKYSDKGYEIELKQEQGYFLNKPNDLITYRTYVRIYKNGEMIKRRLWYIDNPDWRIFVKDFLKTIH